MQLKEEFSFCRKECRNLQTEQETVKTMSERKMQEVQNHLNKQLEVLSENINKTGFMQKNEHLRFTSQADHSKQMLNEFENERQYLLSLVHGVERSLGIETNPNENFTKPLVDMNLTDANAAQKTVTLNIVQ